jgi:lipopolysaccharide transport system permease protein
MPTEQEAVAPLTILSADCQPDEGEVRFSTVCQRRLAYLDIKEGLEKWRIWLMLAYQDIKLRYRRSILGPFWLTLSMAITVYTMGFLYGRLFHADLQHYYPFLVSGMLIWTMIAASITELTDTFITSDGFIKQIKLPYSLYIHRVVTRNMLIFFHNLLVMLPIYFLFHQGAKINAYSLLFFPSLALIYLNAIVYGLILAMVGSRYRDVSQIIKSLVNIIFFITPIMWQPSILPEKDRIFVFINPFYSFIELIRAPLLGTTPTLLNLFVTLLVTLVGVVICATMFTKYRSRIIYWL